MRGSSKIGLVIICCLWVKKNNEKIYFYYHDRPKKYIEIAEDFITFIK